MATDNRTVVNDASTLGDWATDATREAITTTAGFFYEGTNGFEVQHTNAQDASYVTVQRPGGTALNEDLTDATVYALVKDNLLVSEANNGITIMLGDGTRRYGYTVGGFDGGGMILPQFFRCYKLDVSNISTTTPDVTFQGSGTLNTAAITQIGIGAEHASKARSTPTNLFIDYITYGTNTTYHITINGGTVGTPETLGDVATDDASSSTAPWGAVSQPFTGLFTLIANTQIGDTGTGSSYFSTSGESILFLGETMAAGNFLFRLVGNATGTNSFTAANSSFTAVTRTTGTRVQMDWSDANFDIIDVNGCSFVDIGTQTWGANDVDKVINGTSFTNCDPISFNGTTVTNCTFNGANNANGVMLVDNATEVSSQTGLTFNADVSGTPSGHAVEITATTGTFAFTNWIFTSGDFSTGTDANGGSTGDTNAAVFCSATTGSITISVDGGTTPSVRSAGVTVTVVNNVTAAVTGVLGATEVKVLPTAGSPYSGNSLNDTLSISTEMVSADMIQGDGTDYVSYSNNNGKVRINANGSAVFDGVLNDGDTVSNSPNGSALTDGDVVCVFIRDDDDNPTLQIADEFTVASGGTGQTAPTSTTIDTDTDFATFTSVFGTPLTGSNSKKVSVERKDARFEFSVQSGTTVDFLAFRIGSDPVLTLNQTITSDNRTFPISQVGDRNYINPA